MKKLILITCLLLAAASITNHAQQTDFPKLTDPYLGQKPPGMVPEIFAPGIVSKEGIQSKLLIVPDGTEIIYKNMMSTGNASADRKTSFISIKQVNGFWSSPVDIPFSLEFMNDEPALSSDGQKLFFVSNRPKTDSTEPQKMPDIWVSERTTNGWSTPQNAGMPVNTEGIEVQPFYSIDNKLYFGRKDGLYYSQYSNGTFSDPIKLDDSIFKGRIRGICISPDNDAMIVHSDMPGGSGKWDLYISFKDKTGNWTQLINMGTTVNTDQPEANATFSPDGKYLFFSRGDDIYWVSAKIIEELRPKE